MAQRRLLTTGNAFLRTDGRWGSVVWHMDKRDVPPNQTTVDTILDLRAKRYFGGDSPLIPDEHGDYTRPVNFRKRYYRILEAAGIERKGLHSIRHTFVANLVNGIKQPDGAIRSLTPRQMPDLPWHSTSETTGLLCAEGHGAAEWDHRGVRAVGRAKFALP